MRQEFSHLGVYSDWAAARLAAQSAREMLPAAEVRRRVKALLDVPDVSEQPHDVRIRNRWERDGVSGLELSWSAGYGPRTQAWLLRPARSAGLPLPGVVALHGHDGHKFYGKEKIADGPAQLPEAVHALRAGLYDGRAFASDLAREGFAVLVHDVFGWGSRRFPYREMPELLRRLTEATRDVVPPDSLAHSGATEIAGYNTAAWHHEHLIAKYCTMLGTSLAAVVSAEDRMAASYLASRPDVAGQVGCVGLSGGGCRAALLTATCDEIAAAVIVGMMSTYDALADHSVIDHTWMLFPPGLSVFADWPDLAACHAPAPLLVQYNRDDALFPLPGAERAHSRITRHYATAPGSYHGNFYDGGHKFDRAMQREAFAWLHACLAPRLPGLG
jgi:dienelactone hydrolase